MKPTGSFATKSSTGILLALVLITGASHSFSCIGCEVATSYRAAVRAYDKVHSWSVIARWWINPEYAPSMRDQQPAAAKVDDVCEMLPTGVNPR